MSQKPLQKIESGRRFPESENNPDLSSPAQTLACPLEDSLEDYILQMMTLQSQSHLQNCSHSLLELNLEIPSVEIFSVTADVSSWQLLGIVKYWPFRPTWCPARISDSEAKIAPLLCENHVRELRTFFIVVVLKSNIHTFSMLSETLSDFLKSKLCQTQRTIFKHGATHSKQNLCWFSSKAMAVYSLQKQTKQRNTRSALSNFIIRRSTLLDLTLQKSSCLTQARSGKQRLPWSSPVPKLFLTLNTAQRNARFHMENVLLDYTLVWRSRLAGKSLSSVCPTNKLGHRTSKQQFSTAFLCWQLLKDLKDAAAIGTK